jgi:hypothetical protein
MQLRGVSVVLLVVLCGCIHHWVVVHDPAQARDQRVRVLHANGTAETLDHVRVCGATRIGGLPAGTPGTCDCAATCHVADLVRDQVRVRRVNRWATAGLIGGIVVVVVVGLGAWAVAAAGIAGG